MLDTCGAGTSPKAPGHEDGHPPPPSKDLWYPESSCDRRCIQEPGPTVGRLRQAVRLLAALAVLCGALLLALADYTVLGRGGRGLRGWFRMLLRALGVRLTLHGEWPRLARGRGTLLVCNHVSWLDIFAVNAAAPARFVVKSELRSWPVVATLARSRASIYLDRSRPKSLPQTVASVTEALKEGAVVGVFPEGTTWCGIRGGTYRPALLQAAIDAGAPIQPVVIRYRTNCDKPATSVAFLDTPLPQSVRRVLAERRLHLEVHLLAEIRPAASLDRRRLAARIQAAAEATR